MSHVVSIDLDETASLIRDNLDLALPHITQQAHVNPQAALKTVITQYAYADLILRNLDQKYVLEIERFETLRREARSLIKAFWEHYQLFPIELSNGKTVQAQVVQPTPQKHIKHVDSNGRKPRVILTDEQRDEIRAYVRKHDPFQEDDYQLLMMEFGISRGGINHYRYEGQ